MKRCIKWLINWFTQWVEKMSWFERVGFALGGVLGIVIGIMFFVSIDKVPATSADYQQLEEQTIYVQQSPESLLETNCNIDINDEIIESLRIEINNQKNKI